MSQFVRQVAARIPPWLGGHVQRLPTWASFGYTGPFNAQRGRAAAVAAMFRAVSFAAVIETGTYRALTTLHLRRLTNAPIATIEINPRYHAYARRRLRSQTGVLPLMGDSPTVIAELAGDPAWRVEPLFLYLDAHWLDLLPLVDELLVARRGWRDFAAVIDDFRVDGDDGYEYDDYGPGQSLDLSLLGAEELADLVVFWPSMPSAQETGARRGWVVLASPGPVADRMAHLPHLRAAGSLRHALSRR